MLIKTLLNKIERFKSFPYGKCQLETVAGQDALVINMQSRRNSKDHWKQGLETGGWKQGWKQGRTTLIN